MEETIPAGASGTNDLDLVADIELMTFHKFWVQSHRWAGGRRAWGFGRVVGYSGWRVSGQYPMGCRSRSMLTPFVFIPIL